MGSLFCALPWNCWTLNCDDEAARFLGMRAREHVDDIGQRLALLTIELAQLQENPPDLSAEVRRRMSKLQKQTSEIATDIQVLSHELHSSKLNYLGIAAAVRGIRVRVGLEATGYSRWFERLLAELGFEVCPAREVVA